MDDFYTKLAEILEVDRVAADDVLSEFEYWDSLTVLSVLAMLDSGYGVNLTAANLRGLKQAGELAAVVESRRQK
ncbi:MAG TPA: phosphopantetheine-binding protein [Steroidobacteraceae bacterium]